MIIIIVRDRFHDVVQKSRGNGSQEGRLGCEIRESNGLRTDKLLGRTMLRCYVIDSF